MAFHVTKHTSSWKGQTFIMDFIQTPSFLPRQARPVWQKCFMKIHWESPNNPPTDWYKLDLGDDGILIYMPIPCFDLNQDPCANWLHWSELTPHHGDNIRALALSPGVDINDPELETRIGTTILYKEFQIETNRILEQGESTSFPVVQLCNRQSNELVRSITRTLTFRIQAEFEKLHKEKSEHEWKRPRNSKLEADKPSVNQQQPQQNVNNQPTYQPMPFQGTNVWGPMGFPNNYTPMTGPYPGTPFMTNPQPQAKPNTQ